MDEHITKWLDAYYDGELKGSRLKQVETHLAWCEVCQADYDAMMEISDLLRDDPLPASQISTERFVTQVELRLPREQAAPHWSNRLVRSGWSFMPVLLAFTWILIQVSTVIGVLVSRVFEFHIFASPADCLNVLNTQQIAIKFMTCNVGMVSRYAWLWAINLLYVSWLAIWWVSKTRQRNEV